MSLEDLNDIQRYLVEEEAENWEEGAISRREFIRRITLLLGGAIAAGPILMAYGCGPEDAAITASPAPTATAAALTATNTPGSAASPTAAATQPAGQNGGSPFHVPETDPAVGAEMVSFPAAASGVDLIGYLATPAAASGKLAGVLVIHENRGLTEHIKDIVRRVAKAGYVGLGVDLLSRQGGTAALPDDAARSAALGQTSPEQLAADLGAGLDFLEAHDLVDPARLGATGFCFGGGMTWRLATQRADLRAAVPYYGPNPPLEAVPNIKAAVLGIYGGDDTRITGQVPVLEEALKAAGVTYEIRVYEGADHAFHNDTGGRYNPDAARQAWEETLAWFQAHLQ